MLFNNEHQLTITTDIHLATITNLPSLVLTVNTYIEGFHFARPHNNCRCYMQYAVCTVHTLP